VVQFCRNIASHASYHVLIAASISKRKSGLADGGEQTFNLIDLQDTYTSQKLAYQQQETA